MYLRTSGNALESARNLPDKNTATTFNTLQHTAAQCYRVAKNHKTPYLYTSFSAKEPCNWWLFCEDGPPTSGILCVFATLYTVQHLTNAATVDWRVIIKYSQTSARYYIQPTNSL